MFSAMDDMVWKVKTKLPPLALFSWEKVDIPLEEFPPQKNSPQMQKHTLAKID